MPFSRRSFLAVATVGILAGRDSPRRPGRVRRQNYPFNLGIMGPHQFVENAGNPKPRNHFQPT